MITPQSPSEARIYAAAVRLFAERGADQVSVSDLAEAAGVARGTIYNNIAQPDALFRNVAGALAQEMIVRIEASMNGIDDPAARMATGLRLFLRRAHEEPDWGRFVARFGAGDDTLRAMMNEPPARDIARAIKTGRFKLDAAKLKSVVALLNGAVIASMHVVLNGHQTWREAGADMAELLLRAAGIGPAEARRIANAELPPLADATTAGARRGRRTAP